MIVSVREVEAGVVVAVEGSFRLERLFLVGLKEVWVGHDQIDCLCEYRQGRLVLSWKVCTRYCIL